MNSTSNGHLWTSAQLRDLGEVIPGRHIIEEDHNQKQHGVPYLTGPSDFGLRQATASRWTEKPDVMCAPNDVLVTVKGAGVAKLNFAPSEPACIGRQLMAVRAKPGKTNADFIFFALQWAQEQLKSQASGATVPGLSIEDLEELEVPNPPPEKHEPIARRLSEQFAEVERARAAVAEQLKAAQALPAALLRAVFSTPAARQWPCHKLIEVADISAGVALGRKMSANGIRQVPYLRVANVKDGRLDLSEIKETPATESEIADCRLRFGDVLLTEGDDPDKLGRGTFWRDEIPECILQNHVFRVRFETDADPAFMAFQFGSEYGKAYFFRHAKQTTGIATINRTVLGNFPLMQPPLKEQQRLASRLAAKFREAQGLREILALKLSALEKLPAALLREAFGGDIHRAGKPINAS